MAHGGYRPGAGRRQSGPDSIQVTWRVSENAKAWIIGQAKEQGVSVAAIVDELVKTFEEVSKGYIVMQKDFSKITVDFKMIEEGMSRPDSNGRIFPRLGKVIGLSHPYDNIDLWEALVRGEVRKNLILEGYLMNHPQKVAEILKRLMGVRYEDDDCCKCMAYENECPFLKRDILMVYPGRPCPEYRRKSDMALLWERLD